MRALVFGATGQVARELALTAGGRGVAARFLGRAAADLTDPEASVLAIAAADADVVVNAAAYTAVDRAEDEPVLARTVNATAPGAMAVAPATASSPWCSGAGWGRATTSAATPRRRTSRSSAASAR